MPFDPRIVSTVAGVVVALALAQRRARRLGFDTRSILSLMCWMVVGAVWGGHAWDLFCCRAYEPVYVERWHLVFHRPAELLRVWQGWRSVGGLFGGLAAALLWQRYRFGWTTIVSSRGEFAIESYWFASRPAIVLLLPLADIVVSVLPLGWALRVAGLVLGGGSPDWELLDLLVLGAISVVVLALWPRRPKAGTFVCLVGLSYAPARIALGFLPENMPKPSWWGMSPTQWGFAVLTLMTLGLLARISGPSSRTGTRAA